MARRVVPSLSLLSHNVLFKLVVDSADLVPKLVWREFRRLPPNHMRIRIGVGNRIFNNQLFYLEVARPFWLHMMACGYVKEDSTIVDIGSGCGRFAHHMRDFNYKGRGFTGQYLGVDIDNEMLDWCRNHFDPAHFRFFHSTDASKSYNQGEEAKQRYALPIPDASVDFVFSRSLFTHLLESELRNYCEEAYRIMKQGSHMVMSFFCLDYPPPTYGGRHTFKYRIGNAAVESLRVPEAAVAYSEAFILDLVREIGFSKCEVTGTNQDVWQSDLIAQR